MKWNDLKIELFNGTEWVPVVSAKPNECLIAWNKKGVFVWHRIEDTQVRCKMTWKFFLKEKLKWLLS